MAITNKYPKTIAQAVDFSDNKSLESLYKGTSQEWTIDDFVTGGYITTNGTSVTTDSSAKFGYKVETEKNFAHIVIDVDDLQTSWIISTHGGINARMWAWIDENNNIISVSGQINGDYIGTAKIIPDIIYPPTGAKKLIINNRLTSEGTDTFPNPKVTCFKVGMENTNVEAKTYFTTCNDIKSITVGDTTTKYSLIHVPKDFKLVPGVTINVLFKRSSCIRVFLVGSDYVDETIPYSITYNSTGTAWDGYVSQGYILSLTYNGTSLHVTGGKDSAFSNASFGNTNAWASTIITNTSGNQVVYANTATAVGGDNASLSQVNANRARLVVKFAVDVPGGSYMFGGNTYTTKNVDQYGVPIYYRDAPIEDGVIKAGDTCVLNYKSAQWHLLANDRWGKETDNATTASHIRHNTWSFDAYKGAASFVANNTYDTKSEGVSISSKVAYVVASTLSSDATICAYTRNSATPMTYSKEATAGNSVVMQVVLDNADEEFDLYVEGNTSATTLSYFITDSKDVAESIPSGAFPHEQDPYGLLTAQVGDVFVLTMPCWVMMEHMEYLNAGDSLVCHKACDGGLNAYTLRDCFYAPSAVDKKCVMGYAGLTDGKEVSNSSATLLSTTDSIDLDLGGRQVFDVYITTALGAEQDTDYILYLNEYNGSTLVKTHYVHTHKGSLADSCNSITPRIVMQQTGNKIVVEQHADNPVENEGLEVYLSLALVDNFFEMLEAEKYSAEEVGGGPFVQSGADFYANHILQLTENATIGGNSYAKGDYIKVINSNWVKYNVRR